MICQFTPELIHLDIFDGALWESDVGNRNGHAAIFEVKCGKKKQKEQLKHRASVRLNNLNDLDSVALVVQGSDLVNDTKKRQLVTRSGLSTLRCCVCHLHHKWAMNSPAAVREFFGTVLQQL